MKRMNIGWTLWMAATVVRGQTLPADVNFSYLGPQKAIAFKVGEECYVPLLTLSQFGFNLVRFGNEARIETGTERKSYAIRTVNGKDMVPLRKLVTDMGGVAEWEPNSETLNVLSKIKSVTIQGGYVKLEGSLPLKASIFYLKSPDRVIIDFKGATFAESPRILIDGDAKAQQYRPDTVRVVMPSDGQPDLPSRVGPVRNFELFVKGPVAPKSQKPSAEPGPLKPAPHGDDPASFDGATKPPVDPGTRTPVTPPKEYPNLLPDTSNSLGQIPSNVSPLTLEQENLSTTVLGMKFSLPIQAQIRRPSATQLEIVIPGANITLPEDFKLNSPAVESFEVRKDGGNSVLAFTLQRPMGAQLSSAGNSFSLKLFKPSVNGTSLVGKVVFVDAGHGGKDGGCHTLDNSILEKVLTLQISRLLAQRLASEGATVVMSRNSDVFIPVDERPAMANRNKADLFVSIHINSSATRNDLSGAIVFYHFKKPVNEALALAINDEIKLTPMPATGAKKDNARFSTGYGVLRLSNMPGVLVETGYIRNPHDQTLMTDPA